MRAVKDIDYGTSGDKNQRLDIYLPEGDNFPVFIYFHGGGLEKGDKGGFPEFIRYLTERGIGVVSANYRMYPEAKYPEFIDDSARAVAYIQKNISRYGNCTGIYVGGSSAGGYLSMMLCFDKRYLLKFGADPSAVAGYLHDAGQPTVHFNVLRERGVDSRRVIADEASPIYYVGTEQRYPPMLFVVSDNDIKNRYEQTMLMLSTLKHFGHKNVSSILMHGTHDAYVHALDENSDSVFGKIIYDFIVNSDCKAEHR